MFELLGALQHTVKFMCIQNKHVHLTWPSDIDPIKFFLAKLYIKFYIETVSSCVCSLQMEDQMPDF